MTNYTTGSIENVWDAENLFYLKSHPQRLAKLLGFYELYKKCLSMPGALVECGVYKGSSMVKLAAFRSLLENDWSRKLIGFDVFGKFPNEGLSLSSDRDFVERFEGAGGQGISVNELESALDDKGVKNYQLVQGDVFETIPKYLSDNPQLRVSLLHLDLDVYEPTKFCLTKFIPRMVKGGLVVFDDYNAVEGASVVVDEWLAEEGLKIEKLSFCATPSFVVV